MSCCGGNHGHNHENKNEHKNHNHETGKPISTMPIVFGLIALAGLAFYFLR